MKLVGNGCEKAKHHLNPSWGNPKNAAFATPTQGAERAPSKPLKLSMARPEHGTKEHLRNRYSKPLKLSMAQPEHGTSWMKLVGNGCKKAKHHLNLSLGKPKNAAFATPTHGAERAPSNPLKLSMAQAEQWTWHKLNEARRQRMRKS